MQTRESFLKRRFYDEQHYPYGFSRSGDFTFSEVETLERYGNLFKALSAGLVQDTTEDDEHFIKVVRGEALAENSAEKVWLKYLTRSNRAPVWLTARSKVANDDSMDLDDSDSDYDNALEA